MHAHQALASTRGFLAPSGKEQPLAGLSYAGFHALIGGIFAAALDRDFDARGIVKDRWEAGSRNEASLAEFSSLHIERESQFIGVPLKRL